MQNNFLNATVIFPVKNVKETVKFYNEKLGFEINGVWENPIDNSVYGSVKRDNIYIEFGENRKEFVGSGTCLILVENANDIYEELQNKNIEFIGDFANRDYGNRDFRIKDNNGNTLIIGESLKNKEELLKNSKI